MSNEENEKKEYLFLPAPFFMVRTPILPIEDFFGLTQHEDIKEAILSIYKTNPIIQEAIYVASPSLHQALEKKKWDNEQISSLLRYLLRMATRSTPFGLFAFVSNGIWGKKASAQFDVKTIKKRARPDMEWLFAIIDKISANVALFPDLPIRSNPLIFSLGDRVFLNYVRNKENEKTKKTFSIRTNVLIKEIFNKAENPVRIKDLEAQIIKDLPSLDPVKLRGVIKSLLEQQFLLLNLFPTLLTESPFNDLIKKLSCLPILEFSSFDDISCQISIYNQTDLDKGGIEHIKNIEEGMKKASTSNNLLQIDSVCKNHCLTLPRGVAKELQESVEVLWKLSPDEKESSHLREYHSKFLDKYGTERLVSIKELLNEDAGLGLPEGYSDSYQKKEEQSEKEKVWKNWLRREWASCLQEGRNEIVLTEKILKKNELQNEKEKAILSFDLFCEISANSPEDLDRGDFLIYVSGITPQAGSVFGRFLDLFEENVRDALKQVLRQEEELENDRLFLESSYLPLSARSANVATHSNLRFYKVDLSTSENSEGLIPIEDIYVGCNVDRLYLISKKEKKELIIKTGNVLNSAYAPEILRFLRDVSIMKYKQVYPFSWPDFEEAIFLPRLRYKKTIFSPAQWRLDLGGIEASEKDSEAVIEKKLLEWGDKWKLPRYIFMASGDNRILLDYHHSTHRNQIISRLKKREAVVLLEKIGQEKGEWIRSDTGLHLSEFVVPFVKNKTFHLQHHSNFPSFSSSMESQERWKLPGSDWLFIKIYLGRESENRFLINHLYQFANFFKQQLVVSEWFFIRYRDPESHLRIRFRGKNEQIITQLLPAFHDWALNLLRTKQIKNVVISTYEREVERYGGLELIELAESLFCADSEATIHIIQLMLEKKLTFPAYVIAALSLLDILKEFELPLEQQVNHFVFKDSDKSELKGFREWKNDLISIGGAIIENRLELHEKEDSQLLLAAWQKRKEALSHYLAKVLKLKNDGSH